MRISDWSSDVCSSDLVQLSPRADYAQPNETSAANFPSSWWTLFNDPVLAGLQSRAQAGNLNLQIASERIEQSRAQRSEEHTSELQSLMRISYAVFCLKKKNTTIISRHAHYQTINTYYVIESR